MEVPMKSFLLNLTEAQHDMLKRMAKEDEASMTLWLRMMICEQDHKRGPARRAKRIADAIVAHDEYIEEA